MATTSCARCGGRGYEKRILAQFWASFVKDELDLANSIQTKAAVSYAAAVMDKIGVWIVGDEEGSQIGASFPARLWVYTKAVICNGQQHVEASGNCRTTTIGSLND